MTDFYFGAFSGAYFFAALILGLELTFDIFRFRSTPITPIMRLCGIAMLWDAIGVFTICFLSPFFPGSTIPYVVCRFCDLEFSTFICMSGFTLFSGRLPSVRYIVGALIAGIAFFATALLCSLQWATVIAIYNVILLPVFGYIFYRLHRHEKLLRDNYADIENRSIKWYILFIVWFYVYAFIFFVLISEEAYGRYGAVVFYIIQIALYLLMARQAFMQDESRDLESDDADLPSASPAQHLTPELADIFEQRLTRLMEEEKIYRQTDLCVDDLVAALCTNSVYFYYFMRDVKHTRFYDYVNSFRIQEAKHLLSTTNDKLEVVASACGFKSYNTFNTVFKKMEGQTPGSYRKPPKFPKG